MARWQATAKHCGEPEDGWADTVVRPQSIEPATLIAHEVMESAVRNAGILHKAQILRNPVQHASARVLAPQAGANAQGPGVIVGSVPAQSSRQVVDSVLDQSR